MGAQNRITRGFLQFSKHFLVERLFSVNDFAAFHANQMRMRLGTVAIVMAVFAQIDFQHLVEFFEQGQGFVNRGLTHGWELQLDLFIELLRAGMSFADRNQAHQLNALGGQPEITKDLPGAPKGFISGKSAEIRTSFPEGDPGDLRPSLLR